MTDNKTNPKSLANHIEAVKKGERVFEDAFQGVSRMILNAGIQKITVKGKTTYQFAALQEKWLLFWLVNQAMGKLFL